MCRLVFALCLLLCACHPPVVPQQQLVREEAYAMGTSVLLMAWTPDAAVAHQAFGAALDELHRLEVMMTTWVHPGWPQSDIMRLNAAAGQAPVAVARETMEVLQGAEEMAQRSGGVFDVTMGAMGGLWHFDEDLTRVVPSPQDVAARRTLIGYRDLVLDPNAGTAFLKRAHMQVNLGGIAKGYAVDAMARVLQAAGLRNVLLQAGGDLLVLGRKRDDPWRVGIRDPRDLSPDGYFAVAPITDHAFSTAGDYERAFELDGQRYHHILDPRTGYPANACRSVTILAPSALLADALDDAVFILGPEQGMQLLQHYPGTGAVIVDRDNRVWISENLRGQINVLHPPTP